MTQSTVPISILIPTYRREQVLIDSLNYIFSLPVTGAEVVVIDQTPQHESAVAEKLQQWHEEQRINWLRLEQPSIPKAMNQGLLVAKYDLVLYLDDDIIPEPQLVETHWLAHQENHNIQNIIVAGRVIQPWEEGKKIVQTVPSSLTFATCSRAWIEIFMGGNFSINRQHLLELKGFDENFVGAAFQFEAEFAYRFRQAGGQILFEPAACIHHLKVTSGGTRSYGNHLTTWHPNHTVGDYYYLLRTKGLPGRFWRIVARLLYAVITRHHLHKPWWIPATLISEIRGLFWALWLCWQGPRYINYHW